MLPTAAAALCLGVLAAAAAPAHEGERSLAIVKDHYKHLSADLDLMPWFHEHISDDATFRYCPLSVPYLGPNDYPNCVDARGKQAYLDYVRPNLYSKQVHYWNSTMTPWTLLVSEDGREVHARYLVSGVLDGARLPPSIEQVMTWRFDEEGRVTGTTLLSDTLFWHAFHRQALAAQRGTGASAAAAAQPSPALLASDHGLYSPLGPMTFADYCAYYNSLSFGLAVFVCAALFLWLQLQGLAQPLRTAVVVALLVDVVSAGQYALSLSALSGAAEAFNQGDGPYQVKLTHRPLLHNWLFSDLLGMPLCLLSLLLVLRPQLQEGQALWKGATLSAATVAMVLFAFYGDDNVASLLVGVAFFFYILYELVLGLADATQRQPEEARVLVAFVRWFVVATWGAYPFVAVLPMVGLGSAGGMQVCYAALDLLMKAVFSLLVWAVAARKTAVNGKGALLGDQA